MVQVLDYFKNQFGNIRGHLEEWNPSLINDKEATAKNVILTCARDCLQEIRNSNQGVAAGALGAAAAPQDGGEEGAGGAAVLVASPEELRSRATQSASLLKIVLELVDTLRPHVLKDIHEGKGTEMLHEIFEELSMASQVRERHPASTHTLTHFPH